MNYEKNNIPQQESLHPIIVWILASILFHLLLMLGIITLKLHDMPLVNRSKTDQSDRAILMLDQPTKQTAPSPTSKISEPKKTAPKQEPKSKPNITDYTMIPGRQGIDKQNLDDPKNLKDLPTPDNQKLEKKEKPKELIKTPQQPELQKQETLKELDSLLKQEMANTKKTEKLSSITQTPSPAQFVEQPTEKQTSSIAKQNIIPAPVVPDVKRKSQPFQPQSEQDLYEFVPHPNRVISFKDLNLGFDNNYKTIGNNAHLIQQGITMAAPDEVSLKHLTYYHQCAGMMKTAFATHPQTRLRQNATGKRFRFDLTVDRQGNQIKLTVIQGSGDIILDKIIHESIQSVTLFPKVPSFIEENPFTMHWTFLH